MSLDHAPYRKFARHSPVGRAGLKVYLLGMPARSLETPSQV